MPVSATKSIPADIDRDNTRYRDHVKAVFDMHPVGDDANVRAGDGIRMQRYHQVSGIADDGTMPYLSISDVK